MKKFIVSENLVVTTSRQFKESIDFAVANTEKKHNFSNSAYGKKFVGTIVTFNPSNNKVECFSHYDYINYTDEKEVEKSLQFKLSSIIENVEFKLNQFITFVRASEFDYHGYVGYDTKEESEIKQLKLEHKAMSIYIEVINSKEVASGVAKVSEGTNIDTLELSIRTRNCLLRANIETIEQIKALSFDEVLRIRNLGRKSLDELEQVLNIQFA